MIRPIPAHETIDPQRVIIRPTFYSSVLSSPDPKFWVCGRGDFTLGCDQESTARYRAAAEYAFGFWRYSRRRALVEALNSVGWPCFSLARHGGSAWTFAQFSLDGDNLACLADLLTDGDWHAACDLFDRMDKFSLSPCGGCLSVSPPIGRRPHSAMRSTIVLIAVGTARWITPISPWTRAPAPTRPWCLSGRTCRAPTSAFRWRRTVADLVTIAAPVQEILPPAAEPFPLPVEHSMVLAAAERLAAGQAEVMRYLIHGPMGLGFAFEEEVAAMLAEALRLILEVEAARFDVAGSNMDEANCTVAEREALGQLQAAITRFQEEWGRG